MDLSGFQWQGYADFSVSQSNLVQVKEYIGRQEEHHRKMTFRTSCGRFCVNTGSNGMNAMFGLRRNPFWGWARADGFPG